jgi:signal peptidase I
MFKPKYVQNGELLLKGVRRFLNYRRDILPAAKLASIHELVEKFEAALANGNETRVEELAKELTTACEGAGPDYRNSALAENIEVFFVAIAIALGIRAYIAQPFKIPTGSMQPTLNGIIGHSTKETGEKPPNPIVRAIDRVRLGRSWVDIVAKEDDVIMKVESYTMLRFFTRTRLVGKKHKYEIPGPEDRVLRDFNITQWLGRQPVYDRNQARMVVVPTLVRKGDVIARGYIDSGDQVIVDKFSYHFSPPKRGEVFVFTTKNIRAIPLEDEAMGSIHYIKRLVGLPGDRIDVKQPELWINHEKAKEFGMQRVMTRKDGYNGYQNTETRWSHYDLARAQYMAMGDNSFNSSDSRFWGPVPEQNLVGRALMVYWPFNNHWGFIR